MGLHRAEHNQVALALFTPLPRRYERLAELLSLGQNGRWRRQMVRSVADARPARVLGVASGTARVAVEIARQTSAHVVGVDLTVAMLQQGRRNIDRRDLGDRISLVGGRAEALPFADASFDALTFTYLLRYVDDIDATLRELARVVRPGAVVASVEFFVPRNPIARALWWLYTRVVLPVAGLLTGGRPWWRVGRFLGPSISAHYRHHPLAEIVQAWRHAGIDEIGIRIMSMGGGVVILGRRADA